MKDENRIFKDKRFSSGLRIICIIKIFINSIYSDDKPMKFIFDL